MKFEVGKYYVWGGVRPAYPAIWSADMRDMADGKARLCIEVGGWYGEAAFKDITYDSMRMWIYNEKNHFRKVVDPNILKLWSEL